MALTLRAAIPGLVLALALPCGFARSQDGVDLELVLAVDSSASVDFAEFYLQTAGIARAFRDAEVIEAIEQGTPKGLAVSLILWSGALQQLVAVDWTRIDDRVSAEALAARIEAIRRTMVGETAVGEALRFAIDRLDGGPFAGERQIVDISGDGRSNVGKDPDAFRDAAAAAGITINGLAILNEDLGVERYYADHVIGGREAFVTTARDYDDFARAMRHKLLKEIGGAPVG